MLIIIYTTVHKLLIIKGLDHFGFSKVHTILELKLMEIASLYLTCDPAFYQALSCEHAR